MKALAVGLCSALSVIPTHDRTHDAASCESLSSLALANTTITLARLVPVGALTLPTGEGASRRFDDLPAFCRVAATLTPSSDSDIQIEVWLPTADWNGKFLGVGNGGFGGGLAYGAMRRTLRQGYAAATTNTGHSGRGGSFALGHPEKVVDYAYRAVHEMTVTAKALVEALYGREPSHSYWNSCSAGGGQGTMEAHRYPDDYDGIIAGAPGSPLSHGYAAWLIGLASTTLLDSASFIPPTKFSIIHDAVLHTCDGIDGLQDGLIDDPRSCSFDPAMLRCQGPDDPTCLTTVQVEAVRKLLSPLVNPRTGALIFPPLEPGSELDWARVVGGPEPLEAAVDAFRYVFLQNPEWGWRTLDFDRDVALADEMIEAEGFHSLDPDIRAFAANGSKLLLYHGWGDRTNAPQSTVNYYVGIERLLGEAMTSKTARLFMVPGMGHCGGGEGPNSFDPLRVLEQWVEAGIAPDRVVASRWVDGEETRTRPLCPYPQVARYRGTGSIDDAVNFICTIP